MAGQRTDAPPASRGLSPKSRLVAAAAQRQGAGHRVAQENRQPPRQAPPPERGSSAGDDEAQGCIPAFRPPSPPQGAHQLLTPGSDCGSPGRAQLEAVRALRPSASMQQQRQHTPEGTPGLSEASSVGRAINAQIASSIADLFAATPQPESGGRRCSTGAAAAAEAHAPEPQWTAEPAWALQLDAPQAVARVPTKPRSPQMPVPPPVPLKLATAMRSDSGRLEPRSSPQAFLSPVFMSRKQRSMYCDIDDPVSSVVFPQKAAHRTSRFQRWFATAFGCFVPPPEQRSPAPSMRTPAARRAAGSQGPSPAVVHPKLSLANTEPLRRSLPDLAAGDAALRGQLRACLAAEASSQRSRGGASSGAGSGTASSATQQQALYADLLGLHDEETQLNMASPVIPSRRGSRAASPADAGQAAAAAERTDSLARRNLMDAPRYNQAGSTSQQRRQVQYVHPQQSLQHAARLQRPSSGTAGKAKATHVSLAQLLSVPTGGAAVVAVAAAGSGRSAQQPRQAQRTPPGMRRNNSGSKRGREALGASRHPSDEAAETPKRRDLSKPSYRSEALHRMLSTPPRDPSPTAVHPAPAPSQPQAAAAAAALPPGRPASAQQGTTAPAAGGSSAPVSPLRSNSGAGSGEAVHGGSAPASPLVAGPRLTRAASVRAAATQRRLQEEQAQLQAVMARSPDRWLRAAAAEGLSLRQAAVFVSPGKSARPHYHPSPLRPSQSAVQRTAAGAGGPGLRAATPCASQFDAFAAGEAGVEPYSARMHTVERQRLTAAEGPALPEAGAARGAAAGSGGGALDFAALAADRDAYLQMLQELARGLHVSEGPLQKQLEAHKRPTPPPLPAGVLAAATAAARAEQAVQRRGAAAGSGADTVRPRGSQAASQEVLPTSRTTGSAAEYCLGGCEPSCESLDSPLVAAAEEPRTLARFPVPQPPYHNRLYDKDTTPSQSSPIAQQRMLTMSAAAAAAAERQWQPTRNHAQQPQQPQLQQPPQQRSHGGGDGSGRVSASSSAERSISFGSGGCGSAPGIAFVQQVQEQTGESIGAAPSAQRSPSPDRRSAGRARLAALAALLEEVQAQGRRITLAELRQAGYSTNDLHALRQWLGQQ